MVAYTEHGHPTSGPTADRPANAEPGFNFYDTTIGELLTKTGASGTNTWAGAGSSTPSATVAAAGSVQGDAAALALGFSLVSAADGTKGVILPAAVARQVVEIKNNVAAVLKVYPATGDAINALGANASLDMGNLTSCRLICYDATTWYSIPLLPS